MQLKNVKIPKQHQALNYAALMDDKEMKLAYAVKVSNRFETLEESNEKSSWDIFKEAIVETAKEVIPTRKSKKHQKWMTDDILKLMDERRLYKDKDTKKYNQVNAMIKKLCQEAKEVWLDKKCVEIERFKTKSPKEMFRNINEITKKKYCTAGGCLRAKDGSIIIEKEAMIERWTEYITDLFDDERGEMPDISNNMLGPKILASEVQAAVQSMKNNKAVGTDEITVELIKSIGDFGNEKLTNMLNDIYESGNIPADLSRSIFIALPKKPAAAECEFHRTISIMSHVVKILLKVLMRRTRSKTKPEISKLQCGFVNDSGTHNAIFMSRMLSERAIEMQKSLFLCFIDYSKAFDNVKYKKLFEMLEDIQIDGKDLRIIRNLYWKQAAAIRISSHVGEYVEIKKGVRQGCVMSPDLFNLYSERILRELEAMPGLVVGGNNINNLRYADDTVLIATSEEQLQVLVDKVVLESAKKGLCVNTKKTECMVVTKKRDIPTCNFWVHTTEIKQVNWFSYLGSLITADSRSDKEIKRRIAMSRETFSKLKQILCNPKITIPTRLRVLECFLLPILKYGCETWTVSTEMEKRINAVEMWFLRRILRTGWTSHTTNEEVLFLADTERKLMKPIKKQQLQFLGHCIRKDGMEKIMLTGKIAGKRATGRQRITFIQRLAEWSGMSGIELI